MSALPGSKPKLLSSTLLGSAFLMATSAVGPGFITQTTVFTEKLATSFAFVILCSVLLDIVVQLNIWRVVTVSKLRAQLLANTILPGSGHLLSALVFIGGLAFNIGNLGGAALGLNVLLGLDLWLGALISVAIALIIFWYKEAGRSMDIFTKVTGLVMIILMTYVMLSTHPPVEKVLLHAIIPSVTDTTAILILVGGTVGGYISFAGAHRLLDAGISGKENVTSVSNASVKGVFIASLMRILLFMAVLGVVVQGVKLDPANPAASVFRIALGEIGFKIFGVILWCASITSVVGSAYTSVSFITTFNSFFERNNKWITTIFISISAVVFVIIGKPVNILIVVGALNAFILPIALAIILVASSKKNLMQSYTHPLWLKISGWFVVLALTVLGVKSIMADIPNLWR